MELAGLLWLGTLCGHSLDPLRTLGFDPKNGPQNATKTGSKSNEKLVHSLNQSLLNFGFRFGVRHWSPIGQDGL